MNGENMQVLRKGTKSDSVSRAITTSDLVDTLSDVEMICALDDAWYIYSEKRSDIAEKNMYGLMDKIVRRGRDNPIAGNYMRKMLDEAWFYYCSYNGGENANKSVDLFYARLEIAKNLGFTGIADEFMKKRIVLNKKQA